MEVKVCIGSSCHIKGSRQVIEELNDLITKNGLVDQVDFAGSFCMGNCQKGVCVTVDGQMNSVSPETVSSFFEEKIAKPLGR